MFSLNRHYNYDIQWLENLIPFERDIYIDKLLNYISDIKQKEMQS